MKLGLAPLSIVAFAAVAAACNVESQEAAASASASITEAAPPAAPQIVDGTTLATYKAALPKVAWPELQTMLESPSTLWFDKATMIPSYQDSVGDNAQTPIGARANSQGRAVIVEPGKRLFSDDGKTWAFPFAHTAGTDQSSNVFVVDFLFLPAKDDKLLPVVYRVVNDPTARGGLGLHKWTWTYPKGATLGEVIFVRDASGGLYPVELRTRTRYLDGWAVNAYRPFPTAKSFVAAIKQKRLQWQSNASLKRVVDQLESQAALEARSLTSPGFNNVFSVTGSLDVLPDLGDEALVKDLLKTTTFVSAYGTTWRATGGSKTFAPSTKAKFSIVPQDYEAGLLAVDEKTCTQCHKEAGRAIEDFEPQAVLYGDIWGEDQIFSFHPYDQSRYANFNTENRAVRPAFASAGVVERYDATKHSAAVYRVLD
jgi:hypothetical protein